MLMNSDALVTYLSSNQTENVEEVENLANMLMNINSTYESISFANTEGKVVSSTDDTYTGTDLTNETYFTSNSRQGSYTLSDVYTSEDSGELAIRMLVPIQGGAGFLMGASSPSVGPTGNGEAVKIVNNDISLDNKQDQIQSNEGTIIIVIPIRDRKRVV